MSERTQRYVAPLLIAVLILTLWEGLVRLFDVQQFLLPKPSAIVANLVQIVAEGARAGSRQ